MDSPPKREVSMPGSGQRNDRRVLTEDDPLVVAVDLLHHVDQPDLSARRARSTGARRQRRVAKQAEHHLAYRRTRVGEADVKYVGVQCAVGEDGGEQRCVSRFLARSETGCPGCSRSRCPGEDLRPAPAARHPAPAIESCTLAHSPWVRVADGPCSVALSGCRGFSGPLSEQVDQPACGRHAGTLLGAAGTTARQRVDISRSYSLI